MLFMTLETFPAEDVHPAVAGVHPCMLHLVRMGNGKRHSWLEPVPTKIHWRQTFEIHGDKVSVINTTSELDVEKDGVTKRKVPAKDEVTQAYLKMIKSKTPQKYFISGVQSSKKVC